MKQHLRAFRWWLAAKICPDMADAYQAMYDELYHGDVVDLKKAMREYTGITDAVRGVPGP